MKQGRFYFFALHTVNLPFRLLFQIRYSGTEHIPGTGNLIVCCNHKSVFDPILLALPFQRQIRYMAKSELFHCHGRLFRRLLYALGAFPVRRGTGDLSAVRTASEILKSGGILGIFPQGGCVADGIPFRPKAGAAMLAGAECAPILPAAVVCRGAPKPFRLVLIRFGKVIHPEEFPLKGKSVDIRALSGMIAGRINGLMEAEL